MADLSIDASTGAVTLVQFRKSHMPGAPNPSTQLRKFLHGAFAALLVCSSTFLVSTTARAASGSGSEPALLSGTLVDEAGQPVRGAEVIVSVEEFLDGEANTHALHELARGRTDGLGRFELESTLSQEATRNPDGSVRLEIAYSRGGTRRFFSINAQPPTAASGAWTWPVAGDTSAVSTERIALGQGAHVGERIADLALTMSGGVESDQKSSKTLVADDPAVMPSTETADGVGDVADEEPDIVYRDGETCRSRIWAGLDIFRKRHVPIHYNMLHDRTAGHFAWETTDKTQMQIAYSGEGANYAGGFAYSQEQDTSAGVKKTWDGSFTHRIFKTEWKFEKQKEICFVSFNQPGYDTGERRWIPVEWTLGSESSPAASWTCKTANKTNIAGDTWVSRSTTQTFAGFFALAGVELKATQTTSEKHLTEYRLKSGQNRATLCGRDNEIRHAAFVKEVPFTNL